MPAHTIRVLAESKNTAFTATDANTSEPLFWWRGSDLKIETALAANGQFLSSADVGTINVAVKSLNATASDPVSMLKQITAASCDGSFTPADWSNGAGQLCVVEFTKEEAALLAGEYVLIISHDDPSGKRNTYLHARVLVKEDQFDSTSIEAPPAPTAEFYTKNEIDSRFLSYADQADQAKTEEEKEQARKNIGAAADDAVFNAGSSLINGRPFCSNGEKPQQDASTITIRDGGGKPYNAFSSAILVGSTIYGTTGSMTNHTSRDSDMWLYVSQNYGSGSWSGTKIFSATGTAGSIANGDKEYRYGGLCHLGGTKLMILMHTYVEGTGDNVEWSISTDMGQTWGALQVLPLQGSNTTQANAGNPFLFKGRVYVGLYGLGSTAEYMLSQSLTEIEAGTNNQWRQEWNGNGTENYLTISPDGNELRSYSRVADILLRSTTDGETWANNGYLGLPDWNQTQPTVEELADGTLVHVGRQISLGLEARLFYKRPNDETWQISSDVLTSNREIPAWDGIEKHMYNSIIPMGGGLFGCFYALEADEEWNTVGQSTGRRSSVYYSHWAGGQGMTAFGRFIPNKSPSFTGETFDLATSPLRQALTLTGATELNVVGAGEEKHLLVDGDESLTFHRRLSVLGNYDGSNGKAALLEIKNHQINILAQKSFDPRDLNGCNLMLTPESLVHNGSIITSWDDLSASNHSVTTDAGKEPALAVSASPNGKNCVQGALSDYFIFSAAGGTWDVGSIYAVFNYPNANFNGFNAILPNIIQGDGTTDNLKFGAYQVDSTAAFTTINGVTYDASIFDPAAWSKYGTRMLVAPPAESATQDSALMIKGGTTRLMTQQGFDSTRNWLGKLVCLVSFNRRLTDAEDLKMQTWLSYQ